MKVYMVLFDWSTQDNDSIEVELFDTFGKAYDLFTEFIENEKNPEMSWVGELALDENGNANEGYELDEFIEDSGEHDLWWNVTSLDDYYQHSFIELRAMEVK